jgi:hypothetical protein
MGYDQTTSGTAYRETPAQTRDYCRQQVFIAIRKLQPCTDKQIKEYLQWDINRVTPRRGELVEDGLVVMAMKAEDPGTGRTVNWWKIKPLNHTPVLV